MSSSDSSIRGRYCLTPNQEKYLEAIEWSQQQENFPERLYLTAVVHARTLLKTGMTTLRGSLLWRRAVFDVMIQTAFCSRGARHLLHTLPLNSSDAAHLHGAVSVGLKKSEELSAAQRYLLADLRERFLCRPSEIISFDEIKPSLKAVCEKHKLPWPWPDEAKTTESAQESVPETSPPGSEAAVASPNEEERWRRLIEGIEFPWILKGIVERSRGMDVTYRSIPVRTTAEDLSVQDVKNREFSRLASRARERWGEETLAFILVGKTPKLFAVWCLSKKGDAFYNTFIKPS